MHWRNGNLQTATLLQRWYGEAITCIPGDPQETEKYRAWIRRVFGSGKAKLLPKAAGPGASNGFADPCGPIREELPT